MSPATNDSLMTKARARANSAPIWWTTIVCVSVAVLGYVTLWVAHAIGWIKSGAVPWEPVVGIVLVVVALVSYGGFYVASRRARVAIASSFLLTFLVMLAFVLTIPAFAAATEQDYANDLMEDFRAIVMTVIIAYFGSEAFVGTAKVTASKTRPASTAEIRRSDRDLVVPPPPVEPSEAPSVASRNGAQADADDQPER